MKSTTVKKRQSAWLFKAFVALLVGLPALLEAQTQSQNYIKTTTYKVPTTLVPAPTAAQKVENITYFDGLGRPIQQIAGQQSNSGKDIITHIEYDAFGRQTKEYLPYASGQNNLEYLDGNTAKTNLITQYQNWYGDQNPYSEKQLEASPLNRVMQQAAPGNEWALNGNKTIKFDYQTNTATEVKLYTATATWNAALGLYEPVLNNATGNTYYTANQLYKSVTKDENWTAGNNNTTQEFKDKEGKVVLKRSFNSAEAHDTYYVYDQYGNLSFVLPPLVTNASITSQMAGLCYQYRYDYRNRLVEKKLPGKQWEFIVYDKLDRPVATGPAFSPFGEGTTGWMITKYDALNRPVYTGWQASTTVTTSGRLGLQNAQNGATVLNESKTTAGTIDGISVWYSNVVAPTGFKILSVNYYDDYNFPNGPTVFGTAYYNNSLKPKGLATGAWERVCQGATDTKGETSYTLYDYKARAIQTKTVHYLGGYTQTDSNLDFVGKPISTETRHKRTVTDAEIRVNEAFTYSAQDRLLTHTHQINGGAVQLLANNSYDELGQLTAKKVGGAATGTGLQNVNYSYNIRGWLTGINDINSLSKVGDPMDLFSFRINYQKPVSATPLFNGNISETFWRTSSDNVLRKYSYSYDHLNRLLEAVYEKPGGPMAVT
ncbi:type IV secretion protein Rhs, partial [Flavobacterium branchiophilum NBRC 15030 = ATCC 35035]